MPTQAQRNTVHQVAQAILDTIQEHTDGCPASSIYLAMMGVGISYEVYEAFMATLVETGKVIKRDNVFYAAREARAS